MLELLEVFSKQGHSGFSASFCIKYFSALAKYEPLAPLSGEDGEWSDVGNGMFQNNRCSHVFKRDGIAWDINGYIFKEQSGSCHTGYESARKMISIENKEYLKKIISLIKEQKWPFILGLAAMLLTTAGRLLDPIILAHIIDVSVPKNDMSDMFKWGGFFAMIVICSGLLSYFQNIILSKTGIRIITKIKYDVFSHLASLPVSWFDKTPTGELISRVESDGERVKELFSQFSIMIFGNLLFFIGMLVILFSKDFRTTSILMIPISFVIITAIFIVRYLSRYYKRSRVLNAEITT